MAWKSAPVLCPDFVLAISASAVIMGQDFSRFGVRGVSDNRPVLQRALEAGSPFRQKARARSRKPDTFSPAAFEVDKFGLRPRGQRNSRFSITR
jgi:hypothetical protein